MQLLLCCARTRPRTDLETRLASITSGPFDWPRLIQLARLHRVTPLLYRQLMEAGHALVPAPVRQVLEDADLASARRSRYLAGELVRILSVLRTNAIEAMPFKGPALAAAVYGDVSLREFVDLDILVKEKDAVRARRLLLGEGLRMLYPLSEAQQEACLPVLHDCPLVSADRKLWVELHWKLSQWYFAVDFDSDGLWARAGRVQVVGADMPCPAPEDLLLLLCAHGTKHCWERLSWLCDVAELLRAYPNLDWDKVLGSARNLGGLRMTLTSLCLVRDLLRAAVPGEVRAALRRDPVAGRLAAGVGQRLTETPAHSGGAMSRRLPFITIPVGQALFQIPFHLRAKERPRDRVRYGWRLAVEMSLTALGRRCPEVVTRFARLPGWRRARPSVLWVVPPAALVALLALALGRGGRWLVHRLRRDGPPSRSPQGNAAHGRAA
jgi:hypothetical protein